MSVFHENMLIGSSGQGAPAAAGISRSLRFNSSDSAYLSRTPASAGNRTTWSFSAWVKRSKLGTFQAIFTAGEGWSAGSGDTYFTGVAFGSDNKLYVYWRNSNAPLAGSAGVYRDSSAWYHIGLRADGSTLKAYVNGSEVASGGISGNGAINSTQIHSIGVSASSTYFAYADYLIADAYFIDGQALTPSSFTEVSATTGQLIPKAYSGSFGANGFWLKFSDNSAATATTLGKDYSGNNNNWTPTNLAVANFRSATLTKTGGSIQTLQDAANAFDGVLSTSFYCEPSNPSSLTLTLATGQAFSTLEINGYVQSSSKIVINGVDVSSQLLGDPNVYRTITGVTSPFTTLYMEVTGGGSIPVIRDMRFNGVSPGWIFTGSDPRSDSLVDTPTSYGTDTGAGGEVRGNYATLNPLAGAQTLANGNLDFSNNTTDSHRPSTIAMTTGKWYCEFTTSSFGGVPGLVPAGFTGTYPGSTATSWGWYGGAGIYNNAAGVFAATFTANDNIQLAFDADSGKLWFGKNGTWLNSGNPGAGTGQIATVASGTWHFAAGGSVVQPVTLNANFGQRSWAYAAPAGFKALVDTNLPAPVVAKPSTVMDVKLYTGNGSTQTISGLGFSPDFVWVKKRNTNGNNFLADTVRGTTKALLSDATDAEYTNANYITAFNSDGFSVGSDSGYNTSSHTYVAWTWDAGSSTVTNTQGSITSSVRANASAGFSVVSFTGAGGSQTVGHGLGVTPAMIIAKNRATTNSWAVWFTGFTANEYLVLNSTAAKSTFSTQWGSTPTSTVFGVADTSVNGSGNGIIAYCFAPVAGYSSFGSYTGNGSTDGPFVYTGFRPRWVMIKASSSTGDWYIIDTSRDTHNLSGKSLQANTSNAEPSVGGSFSMTDDILSNGFKLRDGGSGSNGSSVTYVYAAFAENPFQYARAR